jgi:hypothetical protein
MRRSGWTPSIVPRGDDQNVYLVMDDLGQAGCVWRGGGNRIPREVRRGKGGAAAGRIL